MRTSEQREMAVPLIPSEKKMTPKGPIPGPGIFRFPLLGLFLFYGCAQIVAPTGGDKDVAPPTILSEEPANLTTGFDAREVIIGFDEFIQLNKPTEQVIISPPMVPPPDLMLKKRSLIIRFGQELKPNTTYTINFGEAIKDNNEGNILKNYTYVFSTGAVLDSMSVKGKLVDAVTQEPVGNTLVMLYTEGVDSLPDYFTRTSEDGRFSIDHVQDRPYTAFALQDQNSNYLFDIPDEMIGFPDSLVIPEVPEASAAVDSLAADSSGAVLDRLDSAPVRFYAMHMFIEEDTTQFLKRAFCEHYGKLVFVYNRPVKRFSAEIGGVSFKRQWALKEYTADRDTVILWTTDMVPDTMYMHSTVDGLVRDTTEIVMKPRAAKVESTGRGKRASRQKVDFALTLKTDPPNARPPAPNAPLMLIWSHPVLNMNLERVVLMEDSVRVRYELTTADTALRSFALRHDWKSGSRYDLHIRDSAFSDLFGLWNDTIDISFIGADDDRYGELSLKISDRPTGQLIVELLNASGKVLDRQATASASVIMFTQLDPGNYDLRVIRDMNGNGRWDPGRYSDRLQPEPIRIIQKEIEVRANWNKELEWNPNE